MFENFLKDQFKTLNWKSFWISLVAVFIVVTLQYLGVTVSKLPLFDVFHKQEPQKADVFESIITPKLEQNKNDYTIKKKTSFISSAFAATAYDNAAAYAAVDFASGDVVVQKALSQKLPIASLTKVMSAIVTLDLAAPGETITVSQNATTVIPTVMGLTPGEKLNVYELLHASLLTSANDAAQALHDGIDAKYNEPVFIKAMNKKAQLIGLKNTHFTNPQGYDSRYNYSTVEDLAILTHYALKNYPVIAHIVKKDREFLAATETHKEYDLINWNGLIDVYPNVYGMKIGNTGRAGKTTAVIAERNGKTMIAILLNAPGVLERDLWTAQLLDDAFAKQYGMTPVAVTEEQLRAKYQSWY